MEGVTSFAAHSRTELSSRRCSSVRLKSIMNPRIVSRAPGDVHRGTAIDVERLRCARAVGGDFKVIAAAEQRADLAGSDVGVRGDEFRHHAIANPDVEGA